MKYFILQLLYHYYHLPRLLYLGHNVMQRKTINTFIKYYINSTISGCYQTKCCGQGPVCPIFWASVFLLLLFVRSFVCLFTETSIITSNERNGFLWKFIHVVFVANMCDAKTRFQRQRILLFFCVDVMYKVKYGLAQFYFESIEIRGRKRSEHGRSTVQYLERVMT